MTKEEFIKKYKIAKKYHDAIEAVETPAQGGEGYWVYLNEGWLAGPMDGRTIHEYTIKELKQAIRKIVEDPEFVEAAAETELELNSTEQMIHKTELRINEAEGYIQESEYSLGIIERNKEIDKERNPRTYSLNKWEASKISTIQTISYWLGVKHGAVEQLTELKKQQQELQKKLRS